MAITDHDGRTIRCRRLGHQVPFRYCRTQEGESICPLILDCWWQVFDVRSFLAEHLPPEQMERLEAGCRPDRVASLMEIIERAKRTAGRSK